MKISLKKFVIIFLVAATLFQFGTNSILGPEPGLFPGDANWYPGENSPVAWKRAFSSIVHPVKFILVEPLGFLAQEPDGAPPVILFCYLLYWTTMALVLYYAYYFLKKLFTKKAT